MLRRSSLVCRVNTQNINRNYSTHVSESGTTPGMVDVGHKPQTHRQATAIGHIWFPPSVAELMFTHHHQGGNNMNNSSNNYDSSSSILEFCTKKGPIFTTAVIAATQAAKQTSNLIPFCHPIPITKCKVEWDTLTMVTAKHVSQFHPDAKFHIPLEFVDETSGLMELLDVNPKLHPRICHDFVRSDNDRCPRGNACSFLHPKMENTSAVDAHEKKEVTNNNNKHRNNQQNNKNDQDYRCWYPDSGQEILSRLRDVYFRVSHARREMKQTDPELYRKMQDRAYNLQNNDISHYQYRQQRRSLASSSSFNNNNNSDDFQLPQLVNVQGVFVPIEELQLNRAIDMVMQNPLTAVKWCRAGEGCPNPMNCGFAHRRNIIMNNNGNKNYDNSYDHQSTTTNFWPPQDFVHNARLNSCSTGGLRVYAKVTVGCAEWHTGVEMEALTATNAALLTLYDMCKGIDGAVNGGMKIGKVQLIEKIGGKSGHWLAPGASSSSSSSRS